MNNYPFSLKYIGRPPAEELPQIPFGLVPTELPPPSHAELGVRSALTPKEREISQQRIMRIEENEEANRKSKDSYDSIGYLSKQISTTDRGM